MSLFTEFLKDGACTYCAIKNDIAKNLIDQGIDPMDFWGLCNECYGKFKSVFRKIYAEGMAKRFCYSG